MSQAKRPGPPLAQHLGAQNFEDVSSETAQTTSRAASRSATFRGRLRRNGHSRPTQKRELCGCLKRNGQNHTICMRMSLLRLPSAEVSFYHNSTPFSKLFGKKS
eukprot:1597636-Pyramimonas_sp.AAC.1